MLSVLSAASNAALMFSRPRLDARWPFRFRSMWQPAICRLIRQSLRLVTEVAQAARLVWVFCSATPFASVKFYAPSAASSGPSVQGCMRRRTHRLKIFEPIPLFVFVFVVNMDRWVGLSCYQAMLWLPYLRSHFLPDVTIARDESRANWSRLRVSAQCNCLRLYPACQSQPVARNKVSSGKRGSSSVASVLTGSRVYPRRNWTATSTAANIFQAWSRHFFTMTVG